MPEPLHNLEELSVNGSRLGALPPPLRRQEEFPQHGSPLSRQRLQEPATPEERTPDRETPELTSAQKLKRDMDMIVQRDEQRVARVAAEKGSKAKNVNRVGKSVPKEEGPAGKKGRKTTIGPEAKRAKVQAASDSNTGKPTYAVERSRHQVRCRTGRLIPNMNSSLAIKFGPDFKLKTEAAAIAEAKRWIQRLPSM
jgi:hypothetical protein